MEIKITLARLSWVLKTQTSQSLNFRRSSRSRATSRRWSVVELKSTSTRILPAWTYNRTDRRNNCIHRKTNWRSLILWTLTNLRYSIRELCQSSTSTKIMVTSYLPSRMDLKCAPRARDPPVQAIRVRKIRRRPSVFAAKTRLRTTSNRAATLVWSRLRNSL